jgi:hypothetical protein
VTRIEGTPVEFTQIVSFTTGRIDELNAYFDDWIARSEGDRIPHRAVLLADRDTPGAFLLTVQFSSRQAAMENSARPRTGEFADFLDRIADGPLEFRSLDVLRVEDL